METCNNKHNDGPHGFDCTLPKGHKGNHMCVVREWKQEPVCLICGSKIKYTGKGLAICEKGHNHADGSYTALCGSNYCRCCQ